MSEYIPKYPSQEGDDSNKSSSELLAETLKPVYVPQELMLAWGSHLASYSRDTHELLDQVKDSETALNTQYQALLTRVQKYEQMLQDITMDSNEFIMNSDEVNFTGWNILAQASYWDYLLKKEITTLSDQIKSAEYKGGLVSDVTDVILEGLIADNNYISNVIEALSDTPLIRELDAALNSTTTSLSNLQEEYVRLAEKQVADAEALANQQVEKAEQLAASIDAAIADQLDRIAEEAAIRTQLLQELEAKTDAITADYTAIVDTLHTTVIQELTTLQDGITASVSELKAADEAVIASLDAYKVSNGQNIAALQNSINITTNAQESTASQVTGLIASFDQLDVGLSKAQADIVTSNQVRAAEDEALSQQITTINSELGSTNSRIDTVSESVSTLDSATATKFTALDAELVDVNTSVASARQIADSAVSTNIAQASEINTLNSRMSTTEGNVTKKADASALSTLETKVDNADAALSTRIDALVANLTTPDGTEINANAFNALRAEVISNSDNITTHTSQITALNSSLRDVNTGLSANADAVADLRTTVTQQGGSITSHSQAIQQLQSDLDVAEAGLATKASTTALNTTNTNVSNMDGRVTANTDSLNSLGSRIDTVEGAVSTKLDASVISNYYTKGQADDKSAEIAAGKIESYDANLVIGGANLLKNSNFEGELNASNWSLYGGSWVKQQDSVHGTVLRCEYGSLTHEWVTVDVGATLVFSALVRTPVDRMMHLTVPLHWWVGKDYASEGKFEALKKSHDIMPAGVWTKIWVVIKLTGDANSFKPFIYDTWPLDGFEIAWTKLEKGNKVTDWTPNDKEVQQSLNANANAIQTVNAEVARVNGEVVSTANSVSTLSSNVGLLQGSINEVRQTVTNNQESTNTLVTSLRSGMADADDVSMMMRNATVLYEDLNFRNGNNGVTLYNNHFNDALACNFTDKLPDNPVAATRQLEFIHTGGATTPELGGFHQQAQSRANGVFLVKFVAKLPVGFSFDFTANAYGDGSTSYFIGGNEGIGRFKTYYALYRCGATGSFSTVGFVFVQGPTPTPENPLIWYLASSTVYDCLDSKVAPDSVINGIAEAKSTASTAVNKAEATALIAQNIQASLDNTNATVSSNYLAQANATQAIAGKLEKFSSTSITSNENLFKGDLTAIPKTLGPGITTFNWDGAAIFDAVADHSGYIALELGIGPYTINNNSQYGGPVTVSMDYSVGDGTTLALPHFFFGHGYQACVAVSSDPLVPYKWKRIYTTFNTDANFLLSSPHLGLQGIVGRVFVKNLKVERGELTAYSADIKETTKSINGIEAIKTVTIDNNGVMSGYGLISQLKNGQVTSSFGVNADTFFIGAPASNKKPFLVTSYPQDINGVSYPAGTWIDVALIANATIGTAKIADLAVTGAKIANATIGNAKIADLDAAKINTGFLNAARIQAGTLSADKLSTEAIQTISLAAQNVTIYKNPNNPYGERMVQNGGLIEIYDANNKLRVKLGLW